MLLKRHDGDTTIDECLLIISENAVRYLWLLANGQNKTDEFIWLANALDFHNEGIADMHILGLIEVGTGVNEDRVTPDDYVIEKRGEDLLKYAASQGVNFEELKVDPKRFQ